MRSLLLAILAFGLLSTAVDLLLLGHDEDAFQFVPLVLIGIGLIVIAWHLKASSLLSLRLMRITMLALIAGGVLGIVLHYRGNVEFQKETDPSLRGMTLFMKAIQAKTPPALAPAILAHLGLLGLVCTYPFSDRRDKI